MRANRSTEAAPLLVLALGGNAITRADDPPSVEAQFARTRETVELLMPVIAAGTHRLVITHGNGPQVGNILLRSDLAAEAGQLPRIPIDAAVADTQGAMGYMIQQALANALWESGIHIPVATIVTQVLVDDDDPDFGDPSKPVGRFYEHGRIEELKAHGWSMKEDPNGRGWRRVVASPQPREILEEPVIQELVAQGIIVIACGGGGVPVVANEAGSLQGVDAVIDKDLASSLLASRLEADTFAILTEVDRVYLNYKKPGERALDDVNVETMIRFAADGHFPGGSMGPKVEAVIGYLKRGGHRAIITSPELLEDALDGRAGTHVTTDVEAQAS